jgi:hypothetical protein
MPWKNSRRFKASAGARGRRAVKLMQNASRDGFDLDFWTTLAVAEARAAWQLAILAADYEAKGD